MAIQPTRRDYRRYLDLIEGRRRGIVPAGARSLLWVASQGYAAASWLRNRLYDWRWLRIETAPVPVVSIGNLTLGGTGKTPCVEFVARHVSERGFRACILSRGYGAVEGPNDEALLLEENLPDVPHLQGPNRAELARLAIEELDSEVLILDDGFQHRPLARNLDLLLVDATRPWGFGYLTPRGLLRERPTELRRAHAVILTRCDLVGREVIADVRKGTLRFAPGIPIAQTRLLPISLGNGPDETHPLKEVEGRPIAAFCGIGNPDAFFETLRRIGCDLRATRDYPDHYRYTRSDVEDLQQWAQEQPRGGIILTTQKDLVKLRLAKLGDRPLWALRIGLDFQEGEEQVRQLLDRALE